MLLSYVVCSLQALYEWDEPELGDHENRDGVELVVSFEERQAETLGRSFEQLQVNASR